MDGPPMPVLPQPQPMPRVPQAGGKMEATAREFEGVFIGQITKMMMDTAQPDGGFSGGHGEEVFRGILAEEMGKAIAQRGGIGLAPSVLKQIIMMQGNSGNAR